MNGAGGIIPRHNLLRYRHLRHPMMAQGWLLIGRDGPYFDPRFCIDGPRCDPRSDCHFNRHTLGNLRPRLCVEAGPPQSEHDPPDGTRPSPGKRPGGLFSRLDRRFTNCFCQGSSPARTIIFLKDVRRFTDGSATRGNTGSDMAALTPGPAQIAERAWSGSDCPRLPYFPLPASFLLQGFPFSRRTILVGPPFPCFHTKRVPVCISQGFVAAKHWGCRPWGTSVQTQRINTPGGCLVPPRRGCLNNRSPSTSICIGQRRRQRTRSRLLVHLKPTEQCLLNCNETF